MKFVHLGLHLQVAARENDAYISREMPQSSPRPAHLPDYANPPLHEVVLGVQFAPAHAYQQILAGEVWNLFRADFPHVEEYPAILPSFETFGIPTGGHTFNFPVMMGSQHDRFWFLSREKSQLIQFQQDRLLHNWRKVGNKSNEYPRFEKMLESFENELQRLEAYFNELSTQGLVCNQAEISYVNQVPYSLPHKEGRISSWLRVFEFGDKEPDDISSVFRRVIFSPDNKPMGRLTCEVVAGRDPLGRCNFSLTFTVRGAPAIPTIAGALDFLKLGRNIIVEEFSASTTNWAQEKWGVIR